MDIIRNGSQVAGKASPENFAGGVRRDFQFAHGAPARVAGSHVAFEPGGRTAWHTHPLGQTLYITAGTGWVQRWGGPKETVRAGDVVWFPPEEKHWHGATATSAMSHFAIVEKDENGKSADWMEHVTEEQFNG
jgi:quercetin dioxygenase-like cupin family protein